MCPYLGFKDEIRLDDTESIHMWGRRPKNKTIGPRRIGCRGGGATDLMIFTLYFAHFCKNVRISEEPRNNVSANKETPSIII